VTHHDLVGWWNFRQPHVCLSRPLRSLTLCRPHQPPSAALCLYPPHSVALFPILPPSAANSRSLPPSSKLIRSLQHSRPHSAARRNLRSRYQPLLTSFTIGLGIVVRVDINRPWVTVLYGISSAAAISRPQPLCVTLCRPLPPSASILRTQSHASAFCRLLPPSAALCRSLPRSSSHLRSLLLFRPPSAARSRYQPQIALSWIGFGIQVREDLHRPSVPASLQHQLCCSNQLPPPFLALRRTAPSRPSSVIAAGCWLQLLLRVMMTTITLAENCLVLVRMLRFPPLFQHLS
jgi:hypothetical protein